VYTSIKTFVARACQVIGLAFVWVPALGQQPLSLDDAVQLGLKNNFDIRIEKFNVENAHKNNTWGQAGAMPLVNLNIGNNNSIVQRKPANPFAVAGRNISDNLNGQLDIQITLFDGFSVKMNKQRLSQLEQLSYGNASFVIESTIQSIILGYYQACFDRESLQILRTNLSFSKERYEFVKLRKSLGSAITFDVLQEQNNYLTDSANVLQQQIRYKNSLRSLNLLLSDSIEREYALTTPLEFIDELLAYDDLKSRMTRSNTNLRNQFINQELSRTAILQQKSNLYPSLLLNVGGTGSLDQLNANFRALTGNTVENTVGFVNRDPGQPVYNTVNETALQRLTQTGNSYGAFANLTLRWTIFNGGQVKRAIDQARIQEKIGQLNIEQLSLSLDFDLISNLDLYNLRRQLVVIADTKQKAAELNLELANERYKNGALSAIDLRIVQENYRTAALEKYLAIYSALLAKTNLVRLTGGLVQAP
jgi:outer membrane protein